MRLFVFTYAPAGLGHLRVTDALVDSRPKNIPYVMLGSYDSFTTGIHRFTSTNPIAKFIFQISQYGLFEDVFTAVYRSILVLTSKPIYEQLKEIIQDHGDVDEIWVIATHFGMAHQIGAIKDRLIKETKKKIRLIVQVTDDTSQHIWCVRGADITFVPSHETKKRLEIYSKKRNMDLDFEVAPYPLYPSFTKKLKTADERKKVFSSAHAQINVAVPISGAAVGTGFLTKLISYMETKSSRFKFWIIAKKTFYTDMFLSSISKLSNVKLITGRNDNEMISLYELLYENDLMQIEITKPSEQAFKAILPPTYVGGSIILFTSPVGRQEYENIDFLVRKGLMPASTNGIKPERPKGKYCCPRAIRLPGDPKMAADFIMWALDSGLFLKMSSPAFKFSKQALSLGEVGPDGAKIFWKVLSKRWE